MQGSGSWESLGENISQSLRLRKVTLSELSFEEAHMCVVPPAKDHHTKIATLLMQWAFPEMLKTKCPVRLLALVVVNLKSKGENVLVDWIAMVN